jgi:hypothetical protein
VPAGLKSLHKVLIVMGLVGELLGEAEAALELVAAVEAGAALHPLVASEIALTVSARAPVVVAMSLFKEFSLKSHLTDSKA